MLLPDPTLPPLELSWKPALTSSEEPRLPPLMLKLLKHISRTQQLSLSAGRRCPRESKEEKQTPPSASELKTVKVGKK